MLARRRLACVVVLAIPLAAMAFCTLPPGEALRLPMLAMLSTLAAGLFATPANPLVSEAERQARHLAKLDKQQAKEQARQQRELDKHKSDLFAFDQPTKPKHCTKPSTQAPLEQGQAILMSTHEDSAPIGARPI